MSSQLNKERFMDLQDFSGQYSLSKTIMTALLPTDETLKHMKHAGLIESDKARQQNYKTVKRAIDHLHRSFISEALKTIVVKDGELEKYITAVTDKKSKKKEIEATAKPILKKFESAYKQTNDVWTTAYELKKSFTSTPEAQLVVLRLRNDEVAKELQMSPQKLAEMVSGFDGFSAYFSAYHLNRLNIYAAELKATSSANRALTNLVKFAKNREKFQKYYAGKNILPAEYAYLFDIANYQKFLPQSGIDDYNFKIGELHSCINQERQSQNLSKKDRHQLPFFETLYKQILTETGKVFSFDQIKTKEDFAELMQDLQASLPGDLQTIKKHFTSNVATVTDPQAVFLNSRAVNGLLYSQTNNAALINNFLPESFGSRKKSTQSEDVASSNFLSLHDLFAAIDQAQSQEDNSLINEAKTANPSAVVWKNFCADLREKIDTAEACVVDFAKLDKFGKQQQETIKKALDAYNDVYKMYTYFELRFKNEPVANLTGDEDFYAIFSEDNKIFPVDKAERFSRSYDLARNWLTKKPYSLDKWVLKFDCGQLLTGWDVNKEPEKHGAVLKDPEGNFHLVVLSNAGKNALDRGKNPDLFASSDGWQKMEYKLLPGPNKMLPKCFFSKKYRESSGVPEDIDKLYKNGEFKKGDDFNIASLHKLIDFYKNALAAYPNWSMYSFDFRPTKQYESIDQFYFDVELGGYKLDFVPINHSVMEKAEKEGLLYIFQITNKDLKNPNCKKPNLHTLYFLEALQPDSNIKLNGEAEIFFRPKSLEPEYKKDGNDFVLTPQGSKIIANRRFTQDRFELHLPLTLNRKVKSISNAAFNQHVTERIKTNGIDAVIGIDRGEKHLTYITIVDKNGKLIREPISFNKISTYAGKSKDYWQKLADLENDRRKDRQNWEAVRKIKDIKDGYVGLCVKKVVDLMLEHNAVVALENLNIGFKQGRAKIERNTYSQFEQALLEKLQYVVKKDEPAHAIMGAQNGAQLTPPDVSPGATNNHMGFVFYVDPSYTSKIDPVSGYRQQFRVDERIKVSNFAQFVSSFDDIYYKDDNLLFAFNWKKLATAYNKLGKTSKKQKDSVYPDHNWTITANVKRSVYKKRTQNQDEQMPTPNCQEELLALFANNGVSVQQNIKQQLASKTFTSEFVKRFVYYFNLINSLRNTIDDQDAIISPVYPNGFDSTRDKLDGYSWDGDANGAYNIARKGVILLQKLKAAQTPKDFKCTVAREEYDQFVGM